MATKELKSSLAAVSIHFNRHPEGNTTGLATLRRDGFASMDANGDNGTLTTRLMEFKVRYLLVSVDNPDGELRVEALDKEGVAAGGPGFAGNRYIINRPDDHP